MNRQNAECLPIVAGESLDGRTWDGRDQVGELSERLAEQNADSVAPSPFAFDAEGNPLARDEGMNVNGAQCALLWAKYDTTARAFLRFWLDAIEYGEAAQNDGSSQGPT